jgi:hypothetical protein
MANYIQKVVKSYKFATVMPTGNVGLDMDGGHDIAYERILAECQTSAANCRRLFLPEHSADLGRWPVHAEKASIWMEDARQIAVAGYRQVPEDGPDVFDSESDSENSDHGEMWSYADMYRPDMYTGNQRTGASTALSCSSTRPESCG